MSAGATNEMREKIQQKITQKLQQCLEYQIYRLNWQLAHEYVISFPPYSPVHVHVLHVLPLIHSFFCNVKKKSHTHTHTCNKKKHLSLSRMPLPNSFY